MLVGYFQTHWSLGLKRNYDTPRFPYFGLMTDWGSTRNRGASASAQASLLIPILSPSTYVSPLAAVRFNMAPFISLEYDIYKGTLRMKLPDFVRVQQLHSSCAFVEVLREKL